MMYIGSGVDAHVLHLLEGRWPTGVSIIATLWMMHTPKHRIPQKYIQMKNAEIKENESKRRKKKKDWTLICCLEERMKERKG